jgi:MFS transporter, ACS family, D-galactonate transporter
MSASFAFAGASANVQRRQWTVVFLLFLSAVINYVDRGSLSIAAPLLNKELGLSPIQLGFLLSAFFWTYALCHILAGWLTDRFNVLWVFGGGFALWSLSTFGCGLATSLATLVFFRMLLGAGESVTFPCYSKIIASGFPISARGLPNAILEAGTKIGPAVGVLIGGLLVASYGWRVLFYVLGVGSLLWIIPWIIWGPRPSELTVERMAADPVPADGPSYLEIVGCRDAWGTFIGAGSYTYSYFFLLTWLPSYLVQERHLSLEMMGVLGSVPYWAAAVAAVVTGWVSDAWIRRGASPTLVRKSVVAFGLLLSIAALPSAIVSDLSLSIWLLSLAYVAFGIFASNLWAISQTLAGPSGTGKWAGLQNCLGAVTGIIAPVATGFIVQKTGSFYLAFVFTAILAVVGALSYVFVVGPIAPIDWAARRSARQRLA